MTAPDVFTTTLASGQTLTVTYSADFGEIVMAGLLLSLLAVLVFTFTLRVSHGHHR